MLSGKGAHTHTQRQTDMVRQVGGGCGNADLLQIPYRLPHSLSKHAAIITGNLHHGRAQFTCSLSFHTQLPLSHNYLSPLPFMYMD